MRENASKLSLVPQVFIESFVPDFGLTEEPQKQRATNPARASSEKTLRLLKGCLDRLDADLPYLDWFRVAAAVFNTTGGSDEGFALFDQWSSTGQKYKGDRDTRAKWRSFRLDHGRPVTLGTLRRMVEAEGHDWMDVCAAADDQFEAVDCQTVGGA